MPVLRRESQATPTLLQEILAYPYEERLVLDMELTEEFVMGLTQYAQELYDELGTWDMAALEKARWVARAAGKAASRMSIGSTAASEYSATDAADYADCSLETQSTMLQIYRALKMTFKAYCAMASAVLEECSEDQCFVSTYVKYWNAYSASIYEINTAYSNFSYLLNEIYNAKTETQAAGLEFSLMHLMVAQWKRVVFAKHEQRFTQLIT